MHIKGLDVSEFQGEVDWERVKSAGCQFAMLRAGYGFDTVDQQFRRNAAECRRLGLPIGAYWFCYAVSPETALREAEGCLRTISDFRLEYPVCYDIEQASAAYAEGEGTMWTASLAQQIVRAFLSRIEEEGYFAMFYTNRNFLNTYLSGSLRQRYALWYARYAPAFDGTDCGIWQYTSEGRVPGIGGDVDLDISYVDYPSVIRSAGLNHLRRKRTRHVPAPAADYITYVIQPGDTLSGIAQRYGTTAERLAQLNNLSDPNRIYAGNTLRIPENSD